MKIAIIGSGYVGLVAGTCFAETGNDVICMDIDKKRITSLGQGKVPLYEPGLEELIRRNVGQGRLRFTTDLAWAVKNSFLVFIAVGTPAGDDGPCWAWAGSRAMPCPWWRLLRRSTTGRRSSLSRSFLISTGRA